MKKVSLRENDDSESLQLYLKEIDAVPLLSRVQEVELAIRIEKGDEAAREHMIRANLRFVVQIAKEYTGMGLHLSDLISEGNIGLMKAVVRFDHTMNVKFCTYASFWIKQYVKRALSKQSRLIRLPVHAIGKLTEIRKTIATLMSVYGREPSHAEIADELNIPAYQVSDLLAVSVTMQTIDGVVGIRDDEMFQFHELIADENMPTPAANFRGKILHDEITQIVDELKPRERAIIVARFGLDGENPKTLNEIGVMFNVTRERIRQVQNIALKKIKEKIRNLELPPTEENDDSIQTTILL